MSAATGLARLRVGQWYAITLVLLGAALLLGTVLGTLALRRNADQRELVVDRIDPALLRAEQLSGALVNQETGIRGYLITGRPDFLAPFERGVRREAEVREQLTELADVPELARLQQDVREVERLADDWRTSYALPVRDAIRSGGLGAPRPPAEEGKAAFDRVRAAGDALAGGLAGSREEARADLEAASSEVREVLVVVAAALLALGILAALALRRAITAPLAALARDVRRVADGEFERPLAAGGSRDVVVLAEDVDSMRRRILRELAALETARERLEAQALELQRSNAELEQFAYVASHDLQEPLRKVASFCQLLERRYAGQLDERADQYIAFAVDGAKRMQGLINDLLAFSRVGRTGIDAEEVDLAEVVEEARDALETTLEEAGAELHVGELPRVRGDRGLLALAFQNLIGNAVKFRAPDRPPRVDITAERDGDAWAVSVADNGIGIDEDYADKIFVIFQRLHAKEAYAGTGIGLAMVRKIAEHHGGTVRLAAGAEGAGSTFVLTLPILESEPAAPDEQP